ncbi:MAG: hypothetical protein ACREBO_07445 [Novosphingobium sp.]
MGLLPAADVKAIGKSAIQWGLADKRDVLFADFDPGVVASIKAVGNGVTYPADLLKLDLANLNNLTEATAEGGFLLSVWLEACASQFDQVQPTRAKTFRDWIAKLNALPAQPQPDPEEAAGKVADAIHDVVAPTAAVASLADELDGYIDRLAGHAGELLKAKRLHDSLHSLQTGSLPLLRKLGAMGPNFEQILALIANTTGMVETAADGMVNEVDGLPPAAPLRTLAEGLAGSLRVAAQSAELAATGNDAKAYGDALTLLRNRIKDDMSSLELVIDQRINELQPGQVLPLDRLVTGLRNLAEQSDDPELKSAAERAAQSLTVISQDLSMIGRRHHDWQALDSQLWLLEEVFDQLLESKEVGIIFQSIWNGVVQRLNGLGGNPKAEWAIRIGALTDAFLLVCVQPPTVPLGGAAPARFSSVVGEIRKVFREVDLNLKASCDRLGLITAQLARL